MIGFFTRLRDLLFRGGQPDETRVEPAPPAAPAQADEAHAANEPVETEPYQAEPYQAEPYQAEPYQAEPYAPEPYDPGEVEAGPVAATPEPLDVAMEDPGLVAAEMPELNDPVLLEEDPRAAVEPGAADDDILIQDDLIDMDMVESDFLDIDVEPEDEAGTLVDAAPAPLETGTLVQAWRGAVDDAERRWAVFANGTAVMLEGEQGVTDAADLLATHGPVTDEPGSAARRVVPLADNLGWVVASRNPAIMTYVAPQECPGGDEGMVGQIALRKRDADARAPVPVHVEGEG